ncbi:MAG: MDR family MFS transporter [Candidatus Nanopelagicales bacterium]|nr:MDR family MFS transporter [Candidatus Nanopelagicales bacterium]
MSSTARDLDPGLAADPDAALIAEGAPAEDRITGRRLRWIMGSLMLTMFLAAIDQTIVSVALPRITSELNGLSSLSWVVTAYLLASTASTPIWGKISDLYGRKIMLQIAIVMFLAASFLAGASQSMEWLIISRGLQGLGGGGIMVLAMASIADVIPPRERGRYTGLFTAVFAFSSVAGPLLGGFFVESLNWRWIFYINLPFGIAAFFVIAAVFKVPTKRVQHTIDYIGAALMVSGVTILLLVAEWGGSHYAWNSTPILLMIATSILLLSTFVWHELRTPEPLVPMSLFRNPIFAVSSSIGFIVGLAMFGAIIFMPVFLQIVQGATPTEAGLRMLPMMAGMAGASITVGRLTSRLGRYKVFPIFGTASAATGMLILSRIAVDTPYWYLAIGLFVLGLGMGSTMQVLMLSVQNSVHVKDVGVATSGSTFFRSIGGTFGTAIFGAVMTGQLVRNIEAALPPDQSQTVDVAHITNAVTTISSLPAALHDIVLTAYASAMGHVFLVAFPVMVIGFILTWFLREVRLSPLVGHEHAEGILPLD